MTNLESVRLLYRFAEKNAGTGFTLIIERDLGTAVTTTTTTTSMMSRRCHFCRRIRAP